MSTLTLPPALRATTIACATVGATILAAPLPPGVGMVVGAAAGTLAALLTGRDDHEPGPDTPDDD